MNTDGHTGADQAGTTLEIDILRETGDWPEDSEGPLRRGIEQAWSAAGDDAPSELCVVLADDEFVRELNKTWRGNDKPTNVLSFPVAEINSMTGPEPLWSEAGQLKPLGDIVLAQETIAREAAEQGKTFEDHLIHLAVHGFLHLMGEDHETDVEAEKMENLERAILNDLKISDPYLRHDAATGKNDE